MSGQGYCGFANEYQASAREEPTAFSTLILQQPQRGIYRRCQSMHDEDVMVQAWKEGAQDSRYRSFICEKMLPHCPSLWAIRVWEINVSGQGGVHPSCQPTQQRAPTPTELASWTSPNPSSLRILNQPHRHPHLYASWGYVGVCSQVAVKWANKGELNI